MTSRLQRRTFLCLKLKYDTLTYKSKSDEIEYMELNVMELLINRVRYDLFTSLKHKDFKYFLSGQCISLLGTWTQRTAQAWLVYNLTKSPFLLGLLGVFQFGPQMLFSLFAGVIVDRFPKRKLLIFTQVVFMIQASILAILVSSEKAKYWHIIILALIFGFAQTLDMPARQAFVSELVPKQDLLNGISLNSTIVNLAKVVGPSLAGIIMLKLGVASCFFINAVSFLPVIYGLYKIETIAPSSNKIHTSMLSEIKEGVMYILNNTTLKFTCIIMLIVCTFSANAEVIIPVFTSGSLHGGAKEYSFLLSAFGIGAFIGAVFMASRSKKGAKNYILIGSAIFVSIFQILTLFIKQYFILTFLIMMIGFFYLTFINMSNSTLQMNSSNEFRGRVMSVYTLLNVGTTPIGNSFSGAIMELWGDTSGFFICGLITLILTTVLLVCKKIKQI